jgi:hypothetical protein
MDNVQFPITRDIRNLCLDRLDGVESVLTITEAAALLRWSYDTVRRYFKDQPGVLVKFRPKRYKRPYKQYKIPVSVFQREWQRMASYNAESNTRAA